ncbi:MAG TPA: sulfate/molybdate ABC transporter ATP-binding protein [Acetobacteraceae bacterium]|nr:sulfate/molybdate ABC transporter ATP-binding protein [Acetobacteraceae bacterium]
MRDIRKSFGVTPALNGISLSVADGEFLALLGPSGSGKTSLLRMLAGLEFPDAGEIAIGGRSMHGVPARERGIGFVFQHYALFRHMTVERNVAFGLEVRPRQRRDSAAQIRAHVRSLLELMEIGDLAGRYPEQISGGQRQRVALARALATQPGLLLLDEPFGALDAKVRKNLRVWLRGLHNRLGLTSVFVTHDQAEAMEMADRIAVLRAGRIEQVDTPDRLYAEPTNPFVHEFLGESVRLDCEVRDGMACFAEPRLPPLPTGCREGHAVALIRPHEIELLRTPGPACVEAVHLSGPTARLRITLGPLAFEVIRSAAECLPAVGQGVGVRVSKVQVFPRAGG